MLGAIVIVLVLLLIPVALIMTGALVASALGWFVKDDVDGELRGHRVPRPRPLSRLGVRTPGNGARAGSACHAR